MKTRHSISAFSILIVLFASVSGFAEQQTYKVGKGDTLYRISRLFNTTPEALKELNGLKNDKINIGQILKVTAEKPVATAATPTAQSSVKTDAVAEKPQVQQSQQGSKETQTYKVRSGDTLSGIARSFNISLKDITAANSLSNNNKLKIGQVLKIPGGNGTVATAAPKAASTPATAVAAPKAASTPVTAVASAREMTSAPAAAVARVANQTNIKPAENEVEPTARDRLVEAGFNVLGVRYRFGGTSEKTGFDCSALVKYIFDKLDLTLPRSSREQFKEGEKVAKEDLQKGDLVFFSSGGKTPTHVGIYIGDHQFLHAASRAKKVVISDLDTTWYDLRYLGARRIMELWWEEPKRPVNDTSSEWMQQLLGTREESQIPLNDALPAEFTVSIQKYDAPH